MVWAWNEETGETELKPVVETYINETDELIHVFVEGEEIICTSSHPFYSPVKGWTDACKLRAGDILVLVNGEYVVAPKIQHEILESPIKVYNFQVEDDHTYYVSDAGVLVHNECGAGHKKPTSPSQLQKQVERGQAPRGVDRVDLPHNANVNGQQPHIHFRDGTSLNMDGTVHDAHNGIPRMTKSIEKWIIKNGWRLLRE